MRSICIQRTELNRNDTPTSEMDRKNYRKTDRQRGKYTDGQIKGQKDRMTDIQNVYQIEG